MLEAGAPGFPVGLFLLFPAAQPLEPVADVGDFVAVDAVKDGGASWIAGFTEDAAVVVGEVEVGLLEGKGEAADEIER